MVSILFFDTDRKAVDHSLLSIGSFCLMISNQVCGLVSTHLVGFMSTKVHHQDLVQTLFDSHTCRSKYCTYPLTAKVKIAIIFIDLTLFDFGIFNQENVISQYS